jgi:hypothetical protein
MLAWMDVLDHIDQSLQQSLRQAPEFPPLPRVEESANPCPLERLDERLARWQACLDAVQDKATAADELLAACSRALEGCGKRIAVNREALARWTNRTPSERGV